MDWHMFKFSLPNSASLGEKEKHLNVFHLNELYSRWKWNSVDVLSCSRAGNTKLKSSCPVGQCISVFIWPPLKYYLPKKHSDKKKCRMFMFFIGILNLHVMHIFCCIQHPTWRPKWRSENYSLLSTHYFDHLVVFRFETVFDGRFSLTRLPKLIWLAHPTGLPDFIFTSKE